MDKEKIINYINNYVVRKDSFKKITGDFSNDIDVVIAAVKKQCSVFSILDEQFRRDSEILRLAIESADHWNNPIEFALPEALTPENIIRAIDKGLIGTGNLSPWMLNNRDVVIHYLKKVNTRIYGDLSVEFRKDPEILALAIEDSSLWNNPISYALSEALTTENIIRAINKRLITDKNLTPEMLSNKEVVIYYLLNRGVSIYHKLSEKFRKDPEILKAALEKANPWNSPIEHALTEALTTENIILAIDKRLITDENLTPKMLSNKEVVIYYLENRSSSIYEKLSEEFRKDSEILKAALEYSGSFENPIKYALPEAITDEVIDLVVSKLDAKDIPEFLLNNKLFVLKYLGKANIMDRLPETLKNDLEVIYMFLINHSGFFSRYSDNILTESMIDFARDNNLEIHEDNIKEIILSDNDLVKKFILIDPYIYGKLSDSGKANAENIYALLSVDGGNLSSVPNKYITNDMIEYALKNGYTLFCKHFDILYNYFNEKIKEQPQYVFDLFLHTFDEDLQLVLLQVIIQSKVAHPGEVVGKIDYILAYYIGKFKDMGYDKKYIIQFLNGVKSGEICALNLEEVMNFGDLLYAINFGNLFPDEASHKKSPMRLRPMLFSRISLDMLMKINKKQYKNIKQKLLDMGIDDFNASEISLKAYSVLGFQRTRELLDGKYGPVNLDKLTHLFKDLDCSEVFFEPNGNKYRPIINELFVNMLFGENYRVLNTPIRNYLSDFKELEDHIRKEIESQDNGDLTQDEINKKIEEAKSSYADSIRSFISNITLIFHKWDVIEEEFLKKQSLSSLKIKLNIAQINAIIDSIKDIDGKIAYRSSLSENYKKRFNRIPGYEKRDYPLVESDVFDYVGRENQFVSNPSKAPARAVTLSRMMENIKTKKIPNVNIDYGDYSIKVFNPQDRNLISAGFRSGCCFRPNANADNNGENNSLLTYCCATEYGSGIEIRDYQGKTLMFSPLLRNGNVLMIHSFESIGLTEAEKKIANDLLYAWSDEVIKVSRQEENEEGLVAVVMTDLHAKMDASRIKATLPNDKMFRFYNPENKFDGMYTNLSGQKHYVLAFAENKGLKDIVYNQEVKKSYEYPELNVDVKTVLVSEEQLGIINQIKQNQNTIINLANKRKALIKKQQPEQAFELLKEINLLRKQYLLFLKELYMLNGNVKRDILSDYMEGIAVMNQVCDELKIERCAEYRFKQIFYAPGFYLGITVDNKLYGNCIRGVESQFFEAVSKIRKNYGLELEYEIDSSIIKNGGIKK